VLKVEARREPATFDAEVRKPGQRALAENRDPLPSYWRGCIPELMTAYEYICAYSCLRISPISGAPTVEHFAAKSSARELAYEWGNYRLVCARMNSRKREFDDVLDPFEIGEGWFELEFLFMQVRPAPGLETLILDQVQKTIKRLKLNDESFCGERVHWYQAWFDGKINGAFLAEHAPFVHSEVMREGLTQKPTSPG
jgi:hypothetical protein